MRTEEWHRNWNTTQRVVAAAVALFLAGVIWFRYGGFSLRTVNAWLAGAILAFLSAEDLRTMRIPNRMTAAMLIPAVLSCAAEPELFMAKRVTGCGAVSLPMFALTLAIPGCFGGGDIKLMAVCGLLLGVPRIFTAAFIAVVTGGCYAVWLLATGRAGRGEHFAFGPFLAVGVMAALLYGTELLEWYLAFITG